MDQTVTRKCFVSKVATSQVERGAQVKQVSHTIQSADPKADGDQFAAEFNSPKQMFPLGAVVNVTVEVVAEAAE